MRATLPITTCSHNCVNYTQIHHQNNLRIFISASEKFILLTDDDFNIIGHVMKKLDKSLDNVVFKPCEE